MIEVLISY